MNKEQSYAIDALRITLDHRKDVSGLADAVAEGRLIPDDVIAVTGKTEGCTPGETSRVDADHAIRAFLRSHRSPGAPDVDRIPMVFTSGGVGILTPHIIVYSRRPAEPATDGLPRLAVGVARSAVIQPEWTGRSRVIEENATAVLAAARDAGMDPSEVEYLVGKAYHVPREELDEARAEGRDVLSLTDEQLFRRTSGSGGLGAAVALDGLPVPPDSAIASDLEMWSGRASFSANPWEPVGGDGPHTQVIALGNHAGAGGSLRIGHAVLHDLIDVDALYRALSQAGLDVGHGPLTVAQRERIVAVYVKVGPAPDGLLRGRRQVTENPNYGNELKAAVAGAFAGALQDNVLYISGSATHQGPAGGGTVAAVVRVG